MKKRNMKRWYDHRRSITTDYRVWFWVRFVKIFLVILIFEMFASCAHDSHVVRHAAKLSEESRLATTKDAPNPQLEQALSEAKAVSPLLFLAKVVLVVLAMPAVAALHEFQTASQNSIDDFLLDKPTYHLAEIFPHKGIRTHRRELRIYKGRVRRFKKALQKSSTRTRAIAEKD